MKKARLGRSQDRDRLTTWLFIVPSVLFVLLVFVFPTLIFLRRSFFDPSFTLQNYARIVHEPVYLQVIWITFKIAIIVTALTVVFGYPFAYAINRARGTLKLILLGLTLLPFWTSLLVRTFAFILLLQQQGLINRVLLTLHVISTPVALVYNLPGVLIGMTYMLLPYMVLPLYGILHRIDPKIEWSATSLGASRLRAFCSTTLPLSAPGVVAGSAIVFLLSLGFFVTPALLGGPREQTISMIIEAQVNQLLNWGFAAALSVVLILITAFFAMVVVGGGWIISKRKPSLGELL
jgi:putative spermidine/putrescine transport system permease protein